MSGTPDEIDGRVRRFVFEHFLREGYPPPVERMMIEFRRPREDIEGALVRLEAGRHLKLVPGTHRILMAFPLSAVATPFRVTLPSGRSYFANCAWDAIALHVMVQQPVTIDSYCHHCREPIRFVLQDALANGGSRDLPVVYLGLPAREWWNDIIVTCGNTMLFFQSPEHLDAWKTTHPEEHGQGLTVLTVLRLSGPLYASKLAADYVRPSREQTLSLFRELGLRGDFWEL